MLDDIKKSINSILYERTTSPLFGTLILSWGLWNWRIIYLTLFISEEKIEGNKIDFIALNYSDIHDLVTYPLISTLLLQTAIPFVSNGAYWLSLRFNKWRKDQKNKIDNKLLLTVEQSIDLREQIIKQEERFEKLLADKNSEIKRLSSIIDDLEKDKDTIVKEGKWISEFYEAEMNELAYKIRKDKGLSNEFETLSRNIQAGYQISGIESISSKLVLNLESHGIIETKGNGQYIFTEKGKRFLRLLLD